MTALHVAAREFRRTTNTAEAVGSLMVRPHPFCGSCGTKYPSEDDQYCRSCGQSVSKTQTKASSSDFRWNWRFALVIPAFLIGIIVPGMLVRVSTELVIPAGDTLFLPMAEIGQSMADGAFSVFLPRMVAPHSKLPISLVAGILVVVLLGSVLLYSFATNYYAGVGTGTIVWEVVLFVVTGLAAGVAMLYAQVQRN
jgi:predicted nucleic acid-binding Zn ribbon protein